MGAEVAKAQGVRAAVKNSDLESKVEQADRDAEVDYDLRHLVSAVILSCCMIYASSYLLAAVLLRATPCCNVFSVLTAANCSLRWCSVYERSTAVLSPSWCWV